MGLGVILSSRDDKVTKLRRRLIGLDIETSVEKQLSVHFQGRFSFGIQLNTLCK